VHATLDACAGTYNNLYNDPDGNNSRVLVIVSDSDGYDGWMIDMIEEPGSNIIMLAAFAVFISIMLLVGWQVMTAENGGIAQLTNYCNEKYGQGNWTLENGHSCTQPSLFSDCIECVAKVD
jgi:hypothetical protein